MPFALFTGRWKLLLFHNIFSAFINIKLEADTMLYSFRIEYVDNL